MFKCGWGCVKHFSSILSINSNSTLSRGTPMKTSMFNQLYISSFITCPCFDVIVKTTFLTCELYQVTAQLKGMLCLVNQDSSFLATLVALQAKIWWSNMKSRSTLITVNTKTTTGWNWRPSGGTSMDPLGHQYFYPISWPPQIKIYSSILKGATTGSEGWTSEVHCPSCFHSTHRICKAKKLRASIHLKHNNRG